MKTLDGGLIVMASGVVTCKPNKQQNHKGWGGVVGVCFCLLLLILKKKGSHTLLKGKRNHEKKSEDVKV